MMDVNFLSLRRCFWPVHAMSSGVQLVNICRPVAQVDVSDVMLLW